MMLETGRIIPEVEFTVDLGTLKYVEVVRRLAELERKMAAIDGKLAKIGENQRERYTESLELG